MRILFIGCVESSLVLLRVLLENGKDIVGVITKDNSSFNSDYAQLSPICKLYNIPVMYTKKINDELCYEFVDTLSPDICYCFGWSQLLDAELIDKFPMGVVGFHPAKLPQNRGRHPLIWALALGLKETASTFFMINTKADDGGIIDQKMVKITYDDNARTLYDKVMKIASKQVVDFTFKFENNTIEVVEQDVKTANVWRKRSELDGQIDFRMHSMGIYNLVRALTRPYVGAHLLYNGKPYKVWRVEEIQTDGLENMEPGKVLSVNIDGTVDIKTGVGGIRLMDFDKFDIREGEYL